MSRIQVPSATEGLSPSTNFQILSQKELIVFNVGDMVIYRGYGVGIVESSVKKRQVGENELSFYALKIQSMVISIPTVNGSKMGLRAIISAVETENQVRRGRVSV